MSMKRVAVFGLILMCGGCQSIPARIQVKLPADDMVTVALKRMKSERDHTLVYGTLSIENKQNPIKIVNLDCIALQYSDRLSDETVVDTFHSVNDTGIEAKDGRIFIDAVWSFAKPINGALKDIRLAYRPQNAFAYQCILHER